MRTGASNHRRAILGGVLVISLVSAGCSSGSSDSSKKPGPVTTSSVKTSGNKTTTSTPPEDDDVFGRPKPTLGDRPEGATDPPIQLESYVDGAGADEAPSGLRSLRSVPVNGGPVRLVPGGKTGWQKVPSNPPKKRTAPGDDVSSDTQVYADGTERVVDHGTGRVTEYRPDGSVRIEEKNGNYADISPEGVSSSSDGGRSIHTWGPDGGESHLDGNGYREKSPDGTITYYDPDGSGSSVEIPPPSYPLPTPPGKGPSGATGEPHYLSEDGASITTQSLGEFVLSTGVPGQEVQARTEPYDGSTTAASISALAFGVDDQRVVVGMDGAVTVDGVAAPEGETLEFGFDAGGAVGVWRDAGSEAARSVVVVWPDLSTAWITPNGRWLDLRLQWEEATGDRRGVLGSDDADSDNDLSYRDGTLGSQDDTEAVVRSWQVSEAESLFDYVEGTTTATYIVDDFPTEAAETEAAEAVEACAGVAEGFARESCEYDVAVTGDDAFVDAYEDYGLRLAGDAGRRGTLEAAAAILGTDDGGGDDDPAPPGEGDLTLSADERDGADEVGADDVISADLDGEEVAVFRFVLAEAAVIGAYSEDLSCPNDPWEPGQAGYAFFDDTGSAIGSPRQACDDAPGKVLSPPGTYYVKLVGPGPLNIDLNPLCCL